MPGVVSELYLLQQARVADEKLSNLQPILKMQPSLSVLNKAIYHHESQVAGVPISPFLPTR